MNGHGNVVFVSGVIAALPGIATFLAASRFGALGDNADFFMDMVDMLDETPQRLLDEFDGMKQFNHFVRNIIQERIDDAENG